MTTTTSATLSTPDTDPHKGIRGRPVTLFLSIVLPLGWVLLSVPAITGCGPSRSCSSPATWG
jgi:hypothetical protein